MNSYIYNSRYMLHPLILRSISSINALKRTIVIILFFSTLSTIYGYAPGDWPGTGANAGVSWMNYTLANGSVISDPSDVNPAETDIFYCAQDNSSVKIACDGANIFFRIQLSGDPTGSSTAFKNSCSYMIELANSSGTWMASVGLNAKPADDYVYVATTAGVETTIYPYSVNGANAMRALVVPGQATNYYLDFQVPIAAIATIWAGFNSTTPIKMFYGTATTTTSINKDWMTGSVVDFSAVAQTKLTYIASGTLILFSISGNAANVNGAVMSYTDGSAKTATADASGNYSFTVSNGWSGTVTPSATGYTFSPASKSYSSVAADQTGQNFSISAVLISGNAGTAGATLSYTDGTAKTATADGTGAYSFWVSYNWSGSVTPSATGYTFTPASISYSNLAAPQTGQNFTASSVPVISGNAGASGVTLSYTDGTAKTVTSDGSGNYSITVSNNWSGTVTPSKTGYTFSPTNLTFTNVAANQNAQNFSVASLLISGSAGISGVTLSYTDGSAKTATSDGSGNYSFTVSNNWTGTVTPSKTGYTFSPASLSYNAITTPQSGQNFSVASLLISGNTGVGGVTLSYTDGTAKTATSDVNGDYSFTVSNNWTGTVTPSKTGYTFSPASLSYNAITTPQSGQNFSVASLSISGSTGVGGVTLSYTDGSAKTATSDGSGNYSFTVSNNWTGTVTPSKTGYTFSPASLSYNAITTPQSGQNFSVASLLISGSAGISGVTLSYTDGSAKTATSDGSGNYSFTVSNNWTGTVTPSKTGYAFSPASLSYNAITTPQSGQNFSVSQVQISGNAGTAGATISYTDGSAKTATADGTGAYSLLVSSNWTGTITPSKNGYTFSPANYSFTNLTTPQTGQDFTASSAPTISGNAGASGVTLSYTDGTAKTVTSDGSGNYSVTVSNNWSGTITPSKTGYTFSPTSLTFTNVAANQNAQNFSVATLLISGNAGVSGVTLSYTDGSAKTATSDGSGNYSFTVSHNWTGTVTPSKTGYTFSPTNLSFNAITAPQSGQNFSVSGITISGNTVTSGVTLSYTDGIAKTVTSDANGDYSFTVSNNWSGAVTPGKTGYTFTPSSKTYTNLSTNQTNQYFTISELLISGNTTLGNVTVTYVTTGTNTVTSDNAGNYSFWVPQYWTGQATASKTGFSFTPTNISFTTVSAPQSGQNFSVAKVKVSGNVSYEGVTLEYTDGTAKTTTSDASGNYSAWVSYNWSGIITPAKQGLVFNPVNLSFINVTSPVSTQNFAATFALQLNNPVNQLTGNVNLVSGKTNVIKWSSLNIQVANLEYAVITNQSLAKTVNGAKTASSVQWVLIAHDVPSPDGQCSYNWQMPDGLNSPLDIRISKADNPAIFSVQRSNMVDFRIASPNGGENWPINSTQTISWVTTGLNLSSSPDTGSNLYVNLFYTQDNGASWNSLATDYLCKEGINSVQCILSSIASPSCKVKIIQSRSLIDTIPFDANAAYTDESDNVFSIYQPNSIHADYLITYPNNGEKLQAGTYQYVTWKKVSGTTYGSLLLEFSSDAGSSWIKINKTPIAGVMRYSWLVPNINSSNCRLRLSNYITHQIYDLTDKDFTIFTANTAARNYPNPFNPSTNISFSIGQSTYVKLVIYNSAGQAVKELINGPMEAGYHSVVFNASQLASGIYYYELITAERKEIHKMLLLK